MNSTYEECRGSLNSFLIEKIKENDRVIDICSGDGDFIHSFLEKRNCTYLGIDLDGSKLLKLKKIRDNIEVNNLDIKNLLNESILSKFNILLNNNSLPLFIGNKLGIINDENPYLNTLFIFIKFLNYNSKNRVYCFPSFLEDGNEDFPIMHCLEKENLVFNNKTLGLFKYKVYSFGLIEIFGVNKLNLFFLKLKFHFNGYLKKFNINI